MPETTIFSHLSDISDLAPSLPEFDQQFADAARARQAQLTKPPGSLGKLEELAEFLAGWRGTAQPEIREAQALVFAGNHGVCDRGVNPFPQEVTVQMVANFEAGGAAINQLCQLSGANLSVVPLELDRPTGDFSTGAAMSEKECVDAINLGAAAVSTSADILILGEMGIGNSTVAAALAHGILGGDAKDWVGRGTGSDSDGQSLKARVVAEGVKRHASLSPMEKLAALGGREQAAICGAVIAARRARIPVVLDGYICTAACAPLLGADPRLLEHCLIGHASAEPGHKALCAAFDKAPILDLGMALGEGSGAALALMVLRGALSCHNGMATFAEAGVAGG
ncbi:nicotinate-nucleotide--dimethylbenzimidazole phosphoribosyltransferase [Ruegeria sp. 2012CJ41-6]|uniref:Nicotinate-nucleotide--dimethylbenzimidazole phosphoribosyltransferase n=1 Tax=Ruegeria spongiae TaxID=2942209 RepID=A0ABT0Q7X3_9RHOB|nr:nicotinate-nucleotide--dimethylbenzimidazole phosphoribosyltransferase [Ruegeria spongiae]MCL6285974.1 nicotinate-nucleotide--dimethylbenzimidazole phosphoribosyltransferase [Ruegeria spongiae]